MLRLEKKKQIHFLILSNSWQHESKKVQKLKYNLHTITYKIQWILHIIFAHLKGIS